MTVVPVRASRSYEVLIGEGLLDELGTRVRAVSRARTAVVIAGENVFPLYGERAEASLEAAGFRVLHHVVPTGEQAKSLAVYGELLHDLSENRLTRSDVLIALGGGVTGDLTGFAAATYQRGIGFVQVPTTLLAAVDSSVGGKTAVNLDTGKNQVGCFYQPLLVLCDPETLKTLPEEEYRCGSAEVIKYGVLGNAAFFEQLRQKPISEQVEQVIRTCVEMKRDVVAEDEFDRGRRQLLNLGHSFGHAVEACSGFTVLHGQAVAIGMAMITRAAAAKGICSAETCDALLDILRAYGLPTQTDYPLEALLRAVYTDKKLDGETMHLIVPEAIGRCRIMPVPIGEIGEWMKLGGAR
ncbi:MAG: 3-dehydroquinate synthase [Oscillospiraceae bacterium]|nr:3-dehydroquinate synthase [Oscillospiraceae bacterium]